MKTYTWLLIENKCKKGESIPCCSKQIFLSPSECLKYHFYKYLNDYIIKFFYYKKPMDLYIQRFYINKNCYFATDNYICVTKILIKKIKNLRKKKRKRKYEKKPKYHISGYRCVAFNCVPCVVPDFPKNSIGVIYLNDRTRN